MRQIEPHNGVEVGTEGRIEPKNKARVGNGWVERSALVLLHPDGLFRPDIAKN